ncbi:MAG TPA: group 1 truncated hemoglobin [Magnetospirillaceae bacterium]|nr:group 1 truncated hemoglobin [Magnetospirillaceae bacterium]
MKAALLVLALLLPAAARADSLFEDLGGRDKISAFTSGLMLRVKSDPRISQFFAETDMDRLHDRLTDFFCHEAGEKRSYRGANLYYAHKGLGIHEKDFDALTEDLEDSMDESGVPYSAQARLLGLLAPLERSIVSD